MISHPGTVVAADDCSLRGIAWTNPIPNIIADIDDSLPITVSGLANGDQYTVIIRVPIITGASFQTQTRTAVDGQASYLFTGNPSVVSLPLTTGTRIVEIRNASDFSSLCELGRYTVLKSSITNDCDMNITFINSNGDNSCVDKDTQVIISVTNAIFEGSVYSGNAVVSIDNGGTNSGTLQIVNGTLTPPFTVGALASGKSYNVGLSNPGGLFGGGTICAYQGNPIQVVESCENQSTSGPPPPFDICKTVGRVTSTEYKKCIDCLGTGAGGLGTGNDGVWTGIGCLETKPKEFVQSLLSIAIGIGGGIAFLLIIYGSFILTTAAGVPDNIQKGREIIGSAISGLLFIIFSVVLLNLIGVQILQIPGL